ncbi:MAG: UDP-3-O-(3-hydroxymyristoyl)glucosamine N-acyltransferase [Bacteroidota bacterium]
MKLSAPVSLEKAAHLLDCEFAGPAHHLVTGFNEIHRVEPGDLTFVDVEKYYEKALTSAATTILINKQVEVPMGKGLLISDDPFRDFNRFNEHFFPRQPLDQVGKPVLGAGVKVGNNVVFGKGVVIEEGAEIGHNCVIGNHVHIGSNSLIHANVTLYDHITIGHDCCIGSGTVLGGEAFYFKARPYGRDKMLTKGRVIVGNHVDIGCNCTIDRGVTADTMIGDWTKLDNLIQIGHDTIIGKKCVIASQVGIAGVVTIEDEVSLWGHAGITQDLTIGKGAVVMGKTGVQSSLEGGKKYLGMMAVELRHRLRMEAALKKLPDLIRKIERLT